MHKTGWANIELPPHLKKAREEQERLNQDKKQEQSGLTNSLNRIGNGKK